MDTIALVDEQIESGQKLLDRLAQENIPVRVACWVKPVEEDRWSLYIATSVVDEKGGVQAYREVYRVLRSLDSRWITGSDIKLIGEGHPIMRDALEIRRQLPGRLPTYTRRPVLGGLPIEEAYIYPPPSSKQRPQAVEKVRLKTNVERVPSLDELLKDFTDKEKETIERLVTGGYDRERAEYWIRQQREKEIRSKPPIPAGTVVKAWVTAWWGDSPDDDPNPLLEVEAEDGAQGLTFRKNTEPA